MRQVEDCRGLAASLGWMVAEEYIDNDLSAYSGKARPAYQRMLDDLGDGLRDAVIVYHVDRLTRRPVELEEFVATVDAAKVRQVRFVVGDMDLGTGDGLMIARMLGAMAAHEFATKSRRVKRKMEQNAAAGLPHGGWQRPFGFDEDKVTVRADEATIIRMLVARFLAGESLRSLAVWMDSEGVRTVSQAVAHPNTARHAGKRPDRRAARAPRHGRWPCHLGANHHRG
jgi:DNA invertase Pin-like site-specific DNA recombinase